MAEIHGSPAAPGLQMPAAAQGPAPVPYPGGRDQAAGNPPVYAVDDYGPVVDHPLDIIHAPYGPLVTTEDPSAYDVNGNPGPSGLVTPYYAGQIDPINAAGDDDPGGRSPLAGDVATAVANSQARWLNLQSDTFKDGPMVGTVVQNEPHLSAHPQQQGSVIGDLMQFPSSPLDPGAGVGNTLPTAAFFDPPRGYGGAEGAPGYVGNEPPPGYQGEAQ